MFNFFRRKTNEEKISYRKKKLMDKLLRAETVESLDKVYPKIADLFLSYRDEAVPAFTELYHYHSQKRKHLALRTRRKNK